MSGFGVIAYLMIFFGNPTPNFVQYNPLAQALMGVLLANLCLSVSRNLKNKVLIFDRLFEKHNVLDQEIKK